jgi:thioredoxin-related protein
MRHSLLTSVCLLGALAAQDKTWLTDLDAAKAAAAQDKKAILALFTSSDGGGMCAALEADVFKKPEFAEWAAKKVVLLAIDFPKQAAQDDATKQRNAKLAKDYAVKGYPSVLFLDAAGKQLGQLGYESGGAANWIKKADEKIGSSGEDDGVWFTDYDKALAKAKREKKVVLADFTGSDWCVWCIRLKDEVFSKPEFAEWAKEHVVLLELDFPRKSELPDELRKQNDKLKREHKIQGFPTIVFLDSKGKDIGRSGYVRGGPEAWIEKAEKELGIKSKPKKDP